ncbi:glucose-induced degradation protein 8 homolog [Anopheles stephensi]|uniref:CTLH domain-containing protein n=1 Tax=Anopheles stephensi TaxID=30069 RepID=A0A182XY55_ANOST|nr:glucose-induced degradation protein 8 homolog [Anopheles stephensi]XP_035903260.1 glucose-induced degradation protein 8 homolog [Anopheles stephensi]XP_035903268.1 glucose-induced degradation protein 8 homolog [Anopheles stephensi]XP_035903278.1 glucose-induced degradation protein 8 homolog [Anopheles stephensi]
MSCNDKSDGISKEEWQSRLETFPFKQDDINKLIMNYLVTEGFKEAAEKFQAESGVVPSVDLNSLDNRILIREAVQNGFIQEATHLVNQLHPELLDNDRYLYFHLQQLHLIELIRAGKIEEALTFAQTQISEAGESNPEVLNELERTLALLAFEKPQHSPFADLLDHTHRQKVASELNAAILKTEQQEQSSPRMINILKLILWAQTELDKKNVKYPKMMGLATGTIEPK